MSSFPSTFRSEYTDGSSMESLTPSFLPFAQNSDSESRAQDAQSGHYLDLDIDFELDEERSSKRRSASPTASTATLIPSLTSELKTSSPKPPDSNYSGTTAGINNGGSSIIEIPEQKRPGTLSLKPMQVRRRLSYQERITRVFFLLFSFIFDFLPILAEWILDLTLGALYLWRGETVFGVLTCTFPILAGVISALRLPDLLKKYKDSYFDFDSRFCKLLSKVPPLQASIFSYHVFKTNVRYYPLSLQYFPHIVHLQKVSTHLNILEGVFEATPQALLQVYIFCVGYEGFYQGCESPFAVAKIILSLVSMSRVLVLYWEQNTPFIFLPDPDPDEPQEGSPSLMPHGYADKPWKKLADCFLMFPYYAEAYTLSALRIFSLVMVLLILSQAMATKLSMSIPEPKLFIPFLTLLLILILPRLFYAGICWCKCLFSAQLKIQWKEFEISRNEESEQKWEYFRQFLKRAMISIFVYPTHPGLQLFLPFYVNLEIILAILWHGHLNGKPEVYSANHYIFGITLTVYYCSVVGRVFYEKCILSKLKSRYLLPHRIVRKCEKIIEKLESEAPPSFREMKKIILDFTGFYFRRVLDKKFVTNRGIEHYLDERENILEMFTLPWNYESKNALLKDFPARIEENGRFLVYSKLPIWSFVNYFCCQVLVYYSIQHKSIFDKFELFQNLRRLHKFKTVKFNMTDEERDVLLSFVEILQPLSFICLINFHTSPKFNSYSAIQNFTHFEIPLGSASVREVDNAKLSYVLKSVVSAKRTDWNLVHLNNFLDLYLNIDEDKDEIKFEPIVYEELSFVDDQF